MMTLRLLALLLLSPALAQAQTNSTQLKLVRKYKESFKIDLEAASGRTHHLLPHPAVFVANTNGVIRFAHANPDYKVRLEPKKILEAVREVAK